VPQRVFNAGTNGHTPNGDGRPAPDTSAQGLFGLLISLMVAEKSGFGVSDAQSTDALADYADRLAREAMDAPDPALAEAGARAGAGTN
jgi:hypothetical protein